MPPTQPEHQGPPYRRAAHRLRGRRARGQWLRPPTGRQVVAWLIAGLLPVGPAIAAITLGAPALGSIALLVVVLMCLVPLPGLLALAWAYPAATAPATWEDRMDGWRVELPRPSLQWTHLALLQLGNACAFFTTVFLLFVGPMIFQATNLGSLIAGMMYIAILLTVGTLFWFLPLTLLAGVLTGAWGSMRIASRARSIERIGDRILSGTGSFHLTEPGFSMRVVRGWLDPRIELRNDRESLNLPVPESAVDELCERIATRRPERTGSREDVPEALEQERRRAAGRQRSG